MKFEIPKINISMFECEDVVTGSSPATTTMSQAQTTINNKLGEGAEGRTFYLTF